MPTSDGENKDKVIEWYREIKPKTVIDIGVGKGTYSRLIKGAPINDQANWTAVEAWAPYATTYKLANWYNNIIIADAYYLDYGKVYNGHADLVIAGDVLEHMTKTESKELIAEFKKHAKNIIISIPLLHLDQDSYKGNWFEKHVDHWHFEDMQAELGSGLKDSLEGPTLGYFWWQAK